MTDNTQEITIVDSTQALSTPLRFSSPRGATIEAIIGGWLNAIKLKRSQSEKTQTAYKNTLLAFRSILQSYDKDLLFTSPTFGPDIADYAQVFASMRTEKATRHGPVSRSTQNQRLAIISSFYHYAIKHGHILPGVGNPIEIIDRPSVEAYAKARAIEKDELQLRLQTIDVGTQKGLRDMAILLVFLSTGRRVSEVAAMTKGHLQKSKKQYIVEFQAKGGKVMRDLLSDDVSSYLTLWLSSYYAGRFFRLSESTPVWVNLTNKIGEPLGYKGFSNICETYLGTSKLHTTRHSFAVLMEEAGAKLTDIQHRLGHANPATTGLYMERLMQDKNAYAEQVTSLLGVPKIPKNT